MSVEPGRAERGPPHEPPPGQGPRGAHRRPGRARRPDDRTSRAAHRTDGRRAARLVHPVLKRARRARRPQWTVTAVPPDWENRRAGSSAFRRGRAAASPLRRGDAREYTLVVSVHRGHEEGRAGAHGPLGASRSVPPGSRGRAPRPCRPRPGANCRRSRRALPEVRDADRRGARARGAPRTYGVVTVTALAKREGPRAPSPAEEARGTAWGRVLHQLLEAAMRMPGVDLAAARGEPPARGGGSRPTSSTRCCASRRRSRRRTSGRAHGGRRAGTSRCRSRWSSRRRTSASPAGPTETLLKGAMDLVFEEDGVWHIVDWKSDVVGDASPPSSRTTRRRSRTTAGRGRRSRGGRRRPGSSSWTPGSSSGSERRKREEEIEEKISSKVRGGAPRQGSLFDE